MLCKIHYQMRKYKTIVVDDHKLFRKGLILLLEEFEELEVIAEASDGKEFLDLLEVFHPELVLMDIRMPRLNGDLTSRIALQKYPDLKIIALSMFHDAEYFHKMDSAGVKGYVLKNCEPDELKKAIDAVLKGNNYYSQELLLNLVKRETQEGKAIQMKLSAREKEVLEYICQGYSNTEIAEKMFLSQRTVETHRSNLLSKTEVKNTVQLVTFAIRNNLVKL